MLERELGETGISVATSIPFEKLMEYSEPIVIDSLWINLRTLIRNIHSSSEDNDSLNPEEVAEALVNEIEIISGILSSLSAIDKIDLIVYNNSYDGLPIRFPHAKLKKTSTYKQIEYATFEAKVQTEFSVVRDQLSELIAYVEGDYALEAADTDSLILTHMPVDLLSYYSFKDLKLLESHTGRIKAKSMWNTKLTGGDRVNRLPFNAFTLQLFGDNATQFYGYPYKYKELILFIASHNDWNTLTTKEKMIKDINAKLARDDPTHKALTKLLQGKMYF